MASTENRLRKLEGRAAALSGGSPGNPKVLSIVYRAGIDDPDKLIEEALKVGFKGYIYAIPAFENLPENYRLPASE